MDTTNEIGTSRCETGLSYTHKQHGHTHSHSVYSHTSLSPTRKAGISACTCELLPGVLNDSTSFIYSGNENPNRLLLRCYNFLPSNVLTYVRTYVPLARIAASPRRLIYQIRDRARLRNKRRYRQLNIEMNGFPGARGKSYSPTIATEKEE